MTGTRVLFAPASGPGIGGGHVMRALTLAQALSVRGVACSFAVGETGATLVQRWGGEAYAVLPEPLETELQKQSFDALIIDDYAMDQQDEERFHRYVRVVAVIDDLADRSHAAELLVDPGYGRRADDYRGLVPAGAQLLTGPAFALVGPAFAAMRDRRLARPILPQPQRAFLSFGLSDVDGIAGRAAALVRARHANLPLDVALASDAASLSALQARAGADANLHLHVDSPDMARLMAGADMAIGAGGASTWERACLALPTLAVIVADNQRGMITAMAADDALLAVDLQAQGFDAAFDAALARLCTPLTRKALADRSGALCDGLGAQRVAEAILAL